MQKSIIKKGLVCLVIILFIGIAVAPGINANNSLVKNKMQIKPEKETVCYTIEAFGLNGGKQTVELTKEGAEKVEKLFDSIREKLNNTATREESEKVFKEAIIELDKYGLLGDLSIEQVYNVVTNRYKDSKLFERVNSRNKINSEYKSNYFCLIAGKTNYTLSYHRLNPWVLFLDDYLYWNFWIPLLEYLDENNHFNLFVLSFGLMFTTSIITLLFYGWWQRISDWSPLSLFNVFGIGYHYLEPENLHYAPGWIWSLGLFGLVKWDGLLLGNLPGLKIPLDNWAHEFVYPAVWGFNGIKIMLNASIGEKFYIGTAFAVGLEEKNEV
jgi:hypothetical protein